MDDRQLLGRFAREGCEDAFRELVRRHVGWVYSAAVRQVRDPHLAQDVAQLVFVNLARRASAIPRKTMLAGWLHRDTRYTCLDVLRSEKRRREREETAAGMNRVDREQPIEWERIRPLLDDELDQLGVGDRQALLFRFFEQRDFAGVGQGLGTSAEAARKRVDRALEKLRERMARRGIETAAAALGTVLSSHAVEAVPEAMVMAVGTSALGLAGIGSQLGSGGWLAALGSMNYGKTAVAAAVAIVGLGVPWIVQEQAFARARAEQSELHARLSPTDLTIDPGPRSEGQEAARDRADLERLRAEVPSLKARLDETRARMAAIQQAGLQGKDGESSKGRILRLREVRDVGQATPEAVLQSQMAALLRHDTNRLAQLLMFDATTDPVLIQGVFEGIAKERERGTEAELAETPLDGIRILDHQPGTGSDVWIVHEYLLKNGEAQQRSRLLLRPTNSGWKLVMGLDAQPVIEVIEPEP